MQQDLVRQLLAGVPVAGYYHSCPRPSEAFPSQLPWPKLTVHLTPHAAGHTDVVVFSNTIGFDAHIIQAFPPLVVGATLVVARPQGHLDPQYIASLITQHSVTGMVCTVPSLVSRRICMCRPDQGLPTVGLA